MNNTTSASGNVLSGPSQTSTVEFGLKLVFDLLTHYWYVWAATSLVLAFVLTAGFIETERLGFKSNMMEAIETLSAGLVAASSLVIAGELVTRWETYSSTCAEQFGTYTNCMDAATPTIAWFLAILVIAAMLTCLLSVVLYLVLTYLVMLVTPDPERDDEASKSLS